MTGYVGTSEPRVEDAALLCGQGRFVDDLRLPFGFTLEPYGCLRAARMTGTGVGGGAFENLMIMAAVVTRGRITRFELFEIDAVAVD